MVKETQLEKAGYHGRHRRHGNDAWEVDSSHNGFDLNQSRTIDLPDGRGLEIVGGMLMAEDASASKKMKRKLYEKELRKLQVELCHLQQWVKAKKLRAIILFEGRDTPPVRVAQLKRSPRGYLRGSFEW